MKKTIISILLITTQLAIAQTDKEIDKLFSEEVSIKDKEPVRCSASYTSSIQDFYKFFHKNFRIPESQEESIMCYIKFAIDQNGTPFEFKPRKITSTHEVYVEAVRVISLTKWNYATEDGEYIKQHLVVPINIRIE